ncbi:Magnesium chelatase [Thermodesulfatator indicus DSM 15286]|uniref:Magnesium chelatase n=1 Tax=Thermodesulfatator indicus (strain DSM 15286 / JCM 11887 / CIR29812) TaxID=667014 RepID=F8ABE7_THEID|nr:cobaltochelatase subunit CobN [Thermodesulfatator indicus]AEH44457.1 Magnesium chelatase [Thermodesulfatator indicus DSM 15286]
MKKVVAAMWNSYIPPLLKAAQAEGLFNLKMWATRKLEDQDVLEAFLQECQEADLIVLYATSEGFWEELAKELKSLYPEKPVIWSGFEAAWWGHSFKGAELGGTVYRYLLYGGEENLKNLVRYLAAQGLGLEVSYGPPKELPWMGIYHPEAPEPFEDLKSYLSWYKPAPEKPWVGLLFSRQYWVNGDLAVENEAIKTLEAQGLNVLPVFAYSLEDKSLGTKGSRGAVEAFFLDKEGRPTIDALIKLIPFFLGTRSRALADTSASTSGVELLKKLNVPVFQPLGLYYQTEEEWRKNPQGLTQEIGWALAMPEFEGVIEPIPIFAVNREEDPETGTLLEERRPIKERIRHLAARIAGWLALKHTPPEDRRLVFVLHNNPCASVEATVGGAANLDALESVVRILRDLKARGYRVENIPENGEALAQEILSRKAISEFRWTTVDEIVKKGGALELISLEQYLRWWREFPEEVRQKIEAAWGRPPGEPKDGVPASMVYKGQIVVTGLRFGNVLVCVQPKRGCAGPRCDGRVCKILHDPDIPPPHQYLATYRYFEDVFGAHAVIHVGTHGNLEFLPGKGAGLSEACFPDLAIGHLPHLYIYNADNPPEGVIAKRRSYAVLVDHMQTVMQEAGLYGELEALSNLLGEYEEARKNHGARAHALEHMIVDSLKKAGLYGEVMEELGEEKDDFLALCRVIHETLNRLKGTQVQDGLHIFGEVPEGERLAKFLRAIVRYDLNENPGWQRAWEDEEIWQALVEGKFDSQLLAKFSDLWARVEDLKARVRASREREALLRALDGGYVPPGPSGLITRGRDDVLPTGRNFYTLDPRRVPTKAAYKVGQRLAEAVIEKYLAEHGKYPENIALYWMANDIMWADGEGMAKILALIGVRPVWLGNGRVKGFEVIPLEELGRPRIDVTIRVSGITRDNFFDCITLVDKAIQAVAMLDEPPEKNFVRKHTLAKLESLKKKFSAKEAKRRATFRLFASKPGTYKAGVNLAVYASAWKDERDLADVFVYWNGYAYGEEAFGQEAHLELAENLKSVSLTFNKTVTDEYDLFGCCSYFGTHGGLTLAARELSGHKIPVYYGDTRDPSKVEVRTLAAEIRRVVKAKLLNPKWIEGMKRHGYRGAGEIAKRIGRVYGWQATTREVDDQIFDDLARTYALNKENRRFFKEHNPWALEEIARRLLEAESRGLWQANPEVLRRLKEAYLEVEAVLEDAMAAGEFGPQGGSVDVITSEEVASWREKMQKLHQ